MEQEIQTALLFINIILPGIICTKFFSLINPINNKTENIKELIYEVIAFGAINFAIYYYLLRFLFDLIKSDLIRNISFFVGYIFMLPIIIAILLKYIIVCLEKIEIINNQSKNAWDNCFKAIKELEFCWAIIELKNGDFIGGQVLYTSKYPNSGHIHITNLYEIDKTGFKMTKKKIIDNNMEYGLVLRPEDYNNIKVIKKLGIQNASCN